MWLMTKYGFYSIVQKRTDEYHVRGRERKDIENLVAGVPLPNAEIKESTEADYAFRLILGKSEVLAILRSAGTPLECASLLAL